MHAIEIKTIDMGVYLVPKNIAGDLFLLTGDNIFNISFAANGF